LRTFSCNCEKGPVELSLAQHRFNQTVESFMMRVQLEVVNHQQERKASGHATLKVLRKCFNFLARIRKGPKHIPLFTKAILLSKVDRPDFPGKRPDDLPQECGLAGPGRTCGDQARMLKGWKKIKWLTLRIHKSSASI